MKILVATTELQGLKPDDFMHAVPGELVIDLGSCSDTTASDDWTCVCSRGFFGVASGQLTTTAVVVENAELGMRAYEAAVVQGLSWCCPCCARDAARLSRAVAAQWEAGTVLERERSTIRQRQPHPQL
ncbi:hypothetical protein SAMN04489806_1569 [Paramicrobacterium humi]|uniref:DUF7715 domain-containing protein n=1 Tax=Paramicrobacterium humi TaxID=640635 RepID=A0A1H4LJL3_9MICO|nr:hypothetical protein [Microbacterium humi]SEB70949.1 hypothetical protein SAMN04489806_1569 [Microbacterium humi]